MEGRQPSFRDLGIVECEVDPWNGQALTDAPETIVLVACEGPPEPDPKRLMSAPDAVNAIGLIGTDRIAIAQGNEVNVRDAANFGDPVRLTADRSSIVALVGNGDVVVAGHHSERLTAWDLAASEYGTTVYCRPDDGIAYYDLWSMVGLVWLNDGRVACELDDLVLVWDPRDLAHPTHVACGRGNSVQWVTPLTDDRVLFGTITGALFKWDGVQSSAQAITGSYPRSISAVATGDGRIVSYDFDHTVRIWDPAAPSDRASLDMGPGRVADLLVLAPDLLVVVVRSASGGWDLTAWDLRTLTRIRTFTLNSMSRLAPGPDRTLLAACGWGWIMLDPGASARSS